MANIAKRPARLDIGDLPRDQERVLGGLRSALVASFNYCRSYPKKMPVLKATLKYVYNRINQWEKDAEALNESMLKTTYELEGRKLGIELDKRKTSSAMKAELDAFKAKTDEEKAKAKEAEAKAKAEAELAAKKAEAQAAVKAANEALEALEA